MDPNVCKERILSEDYRDFIIPGTRPFPVPDIIPNEEDLCQQLADFNYHCLYLEGFLIRDISISTFTYNAIPKCYAPISMDAMNEAGILQIQAYPTLQLRGENIMIGFLDTGIDYTNPIFLNLDNTTRIAGIWDQTIQTGTPPPNFLYGSEYTSDMINEALASEDPLSIVPSTDEVGHGTFVASMAAGSGNPDQEFIGAAPESTIAVVKLKQAKQYLRDFYFIPEYVDCFQENDILLGLRYLNELATKMNMPLVICIAVGTNWGGHISLLPLTRVLENYGLQINRVPVIGVGNEADKRHHYSYTIPQNAESNIVEIRVGENVEGFVMELWAKIPNVFSISLVSPSGESTASVPIQTATTASFNFIFERTVVSVDYGLIVERSASELIFFRFRDPAPGIWNLVVQSVRTISGQFHIWLPITEFLTGDVYFLNSNPYYTLTSPATARSALVVSYYDGSNGSIALSSGRGFTRDELINPQVAAPGINVRGALPGGEYAVRSGSSISTGIASGAVALLIQWFITQLGFTGLDAYQVKSMLILGAVRPRSMLFPSREWGYGLLNLYNTLEEARKL
ncbi:S8 family peptidase [Clostridium sp. C105KSO13]|uniref:S8 family peptidase n=1 Tax=Clostridium sp. C105KSO13 TaxID=1776045 RepID=UPI00074084D9|nr:S8 family peptidase [Clostridium sp. C105KSO13]CUX46384.1 Subtilase family protein [Clostridium sp. C105KSO13]